MDKFVLSYSASSIDFNSSYKIQVRIKKAVSDCKKNSRHWVMPPSQGSRVEPSQPLPSRTVTDASAQAYGNLASGVTVSAYSVPVNETGVTVSAYSVPVTETGSLWVPEAMGETGHEIPLTPRKERLQLDNRQRREGGREEKAENKANGNWTETQLTLIEAQTKLLLFYLMLFSTTTQ